MAEGYRMRSIAKQTLNQSLNKIDDEDDHLLQPKRPDRHSRDDVKLEPTAADSLLQDKSIIFELEQELINEMAKLKVDDVDKLPEKIEQTRERIKDYQEVDRKLKVLTLLDGTITKLKSCRPVEDSNNVMKLSYVEQELINGLDELKIDDVNKLPARIQLIEAHGTITKSKSTQLVEDSSSVMKRHRFEQELISNKPTLPQRHFTSTDCQMESSDQSTTSETNKRFYHSSASDQPPKRFRKSPRRSRFPEFFVPLPEVRPVCDKKFRVEIQQKYRQLCGWTRIGFPGSRPVQMNRENYKIILKSPYMVTWKPAGKRYMMLIEEENKVYMLDQSYKLFSVDLFQFPHGVECTSHLKDTLVDGELVSDKVNGSNKASFLINDIITYNGTDVTFEQFSYRLKLISELIANLNNNTITKDSIKKSKLPFLIRTKDFFRLSEINKLLGREFLTSIPHEVEGFFFLPERDPYTAGPCPAKLRWKENDTIDFLLKISDNFPSANAHREKKADLFLDRMSTPFATIRYSATLEKYDEKIISCYCRDSQWYVYGLSHNRRFPNSEKTAMAIIKTMERPVTKGDLLDLINNQ
ncbi:hypothetical protein I4U23_016919 [Adineta vaga]|nr:hypothetical protein I4U23_016919 [Adineta vaga]